jgi:hypothetical protein
MADRLPFDGALGKITISRSVDNVYTASAMSDGVWQAATLGGISDIKNLDERIALTTNASLRGMELQENFAYPGTQTMSTILDDAPSTKFFVGAMSAMGLYIFYCLLEKYN